MVSPRNWSTRPYAQGIGVASTRFNLQGLRTSMPSVHCIEGIRIRCLEKRRCLLRVSTGRAAPSSACIHAALRASERTTPRFFWYFFLLIYHVRLSLLVSHGFDDISNLLCVCSQPTNCPHCATQSFIQEIPHSTESRHCTKQVQVLTSSLLGSLILQMPLLASEHKQSKAASEAIHSDVCWDMNVFML